MCSNWSGGFRNGHHSTSSMEWSDFEVSCLDESFFNFLSSEVDSQQTEWTPEENKMFENAVGEFDPGSPGFFQNLASRIPWKSIQQIKKNYQDLVEDVEMIDTGPVPLPDYGTLVEDPKHGQVLVDNKGKGALTRRAVKNNNASHPRRKGTPWTEAEHQ